MATPAISVIIPMYNAEKYIGECLDSLRAQTFHDFEVIIVDDCSDDLSRKIVEKYYLNDSEQKYILIRRQKNSGNFGYTARNRGLSYAKGEYVFFLDADNMITSTALEELYTSAKKFNADVVYTGAYYQYTIDKNSELKLDNEKGIVAEQKLTTNEPHKLLENLLINDGFFWTAWTKFVRRQFLIENDIIFYEPRFGGDYIWTIELLCCAKRFVRIPNAVYLRRCDYETSVSGAKSLPEIQIRTWNTAFLEVTRALFDLLSKRDVFRINPSYCYFAQKRFFEFCFGRNLEARNQFKPEEIYKILEREFGNNDAFEMMGKFFLTFVDSQQKEINSLKDKKEPAAAVPKISVVVPLYNAEKYIGECLDSLLLQTFQDFEVIVVDDCSTDNSMEVVKSYVSKFNGRLKYSSTKVNSGGGGYIPRNIGIGLSCGKYICFVDADDFILLTALETLYKAAESHKADVVYTGSRYLLTAPNEIIKQDCDKKNETTLVVDEPDKNLDLFFLGKCHHTPYQKFCRRDFLIENNIFFPEIITYGDSLWTIHVFACSKRFLKIPDTLYFYRENFNSITLNKGLPEKQICYRARAFLLAMNAFLTLSKKINLQEKNLMYLFLFMKNVLNNYLKRTADAGSSLSTDEIFEALYSNFSEKNNSPDWMMPFFFTFVDEERRAKDYHSDIVNNFKQYFTARLDIQLTGSDAGDFQILSVSDDKAAVQKPAWLQKNGIGYVIQSYAGKMEIVAKATGSGKCILKLKGIFVRDPEDKSKHIPYWIDFTKFLVNEQIIFDKLTPAWHDKPYSYNMKVTAGDEIKIQVEWLPHRSNT